MTFLKNMINSLAGKQEDVELTEDTVFIDVRSLDECASGKIDCSTVIPLQDIKANISNQISNKNTPILLYCASGMRSSRARKILLDMGYTNVTNTGSMSATAKKFNKAII